MIGPSEPPSIVVMPDAIACSQSPAESKCTCTSIAPGVAIIPSQSRTAVAAETMRRASDAVHDGRVARLTKSDDAAVLDTEVALDDADDRIDHQDVAKKKVERALRAGHAGGKTDAVAQRLAAAMQTFIAVDGVVVLDNGDQRSIGKADAVADGRAIESGIIPARESRPWKPHEPLKPASRARRSAASRAV